MPTDHTPHDTVSSDTVSHNIVVVSGPDLTDQPTAWPVARRRLVGEGAVFDLMRDDVVDPAGETLRREWIRHPGAVGIIAIDDQDHVIMVRQYRHPSGLALIEPPAGLLDQDGEDFRVAAARELAEEIGVRAGTWHVLVDMFTSPGASSESVRIYLATDLQPADRPDGFVAEGEEADMQVVRAPFAEVVAAILDGRLQNPVLVAGVLAAAAARTGSGTEALRPADSPWPARDLRAQFLDRAPVDEPGADTGQ